MVEALPAVFASLQISEASLCSHSRKKAIEDIEKQLKGYAE